MKLLPDIQFATLCLNLVAVANMELIDVATLPNLA